MENKIVPQNIVVKSKMYFFVERQYYGKVMYLCSDFHVVKDWEGQCRVIIRLKHTIYMSPYQVFSGLLVTNYGDESFFVFLSLRISLKKFSRKSAYLQEKNYTFQFWTGHVSWISKFISSAVSKLKLLHHNKISKTYCFIKNLKIHLKMI